MPPLRKAVIAATTGAGVAVTPLGQAIIAASARARISVTSLRKAVIAASARTRVSVAAFVQSRVAGTSRAGISVTGRWEWGGFAAGVRTSTGTRVAMSPLGQAVIASAARTRVTVARLR